MQDIIQPIDRSLLKAELTKDKLLRRTNKSNNEIYVITAHDSPNVMQEIGRLREIAFRYYGGGTGFPVDIDEFDTMEDAYRQLIVWMVIVSFVARMSGSTNRANLFWQLLICLISPTGLSGNIYLIL